MVNGSGLKMTVLLKAESGFLLIKVENENKE